MMTHVWEFLVTPGKVKTPSFGLFGAISSYVAPEKVLRWTILLISAFFVVVHFINWLWLRRVCPLGKDCPMADRCDMKQCNYREAVKRLRKGK